MAERRFGEISDEELARLTAEGTNQNTCKATATWLITVTAFRNEKKLDISFATCSAEELGAFLVQFYSDPKPAKGGEYRRSSYLAARAAIQQHIRVLILSITSRMKPSPILIRSWTAF